MVVLNPLYNPDELTKKAKTAESQQRSARQESWAEAILALRACVQSHGDGVYQLDSLFDDVKRDSRVSTTTLQLAFDRLEARGELHYVLGQGVFRGTKK